MIDRKKRQEDNRRIMRTFTLVLQLGITMLTCVMLCLFAGSILSRQLDLDWIVPVFLILGILAGFRSCASLTSGYRKGGAREEGGPSGENMQSVPFPAEEEEEES